MSRTWTYEQFQERCELLTGELESIAHFATDQAGVYARDVLVELGVWSPTVERAERPTVLEMWLRSGARMPCHDFPARDGLADALVNGQVRFELSAPVSLTERQR